MNDEEAHKGWEEWMDKYTEMSKEELIEKLREANMKCGFNSVAE